MSEPWTQAWAEAEASAPVDVECYSTIELQHPAFLEEGVPIALRFVLGPEPMTFGIEEGATFNPGTMQEFLPVAFTSEEPDFAQGTVPQSKLAIDNVARTLVPYINAAVTVRADLTLILRRYRDDLLTEPSYGPVEFIVRKVKSTGARVEGVATLNDLTNEGVPRMKYTRKAYTALAS